MSILPFRRVPEASAPLVEGANTNDAPNVVPQWVIREGYEVIGWRIPERGDLHYSPYRDAVQYAIDNSGGRRVILSDARAMR